MLMHLSTAELLAVARAGGGLEVSGRAHSTADLRAIARALRGNAVLHVVNSQAISAADMQAIARAADEPAYVMFSGQADNG